MAQGSSKTHTMKTCNQCGEDSVPQLARNNYFTGKLLVERDFTDEQRYHVGKQLRHNRYLHGYGCVCGLKVKQHPNENCRDQYVVIEPGTAVDCCGRELLVTQKEYFDFAAKIAEKKKDLGNTAHTLQVCLRYSECAAEPVPVLFDDCDNGDTATQPNRIMEGYDFDVRVDPPIKHRALDDVDLEWQHSLSVAGASRIVVDEANQRLYVLTGGDASTLFVYSTDTYTALTPQALNGPAMDVALSRDGSRVYVAVRQKNSVQVFDTRALGTNKALINQLPTHSAPTGDVRLAVSPGDGFLYVLDADRKTVTLWKPSINRKDEDIDDAEYGHIRVGDAPHSIVASPDGRWVLVANSGDKTISAIDAVTHTHHPAIIHLNTVTPAELAVADTDDGLKLYILDSTNNTVSILLLELRANPPFRHLGTPLSLASGTLVDIAASYSGRWFYVLLTDANGKGRVQVFDAHKVERGEAGAAGDWLPVGDAPGKLVLIPTRPRLYVAYHGTAQDATSGGVAIVHLIESTCEDVFKRALHEWSDCDDDDDCVVLATIKGYTADAPITEAAIDNLSDRRLLPSTDLVTDVVRCILDNSGGKGRRGEEGPRGEEGRGIEAVHARIVDCDDEGKASIEEIDEKRTLVLEIPRGCDGRDAELPPRVDYTRICAINWEHRGTMERDDLEDGLLIAFNHNIRAGDLNTHTFQVLIRTEDEGGLITWCELPHRHLRGIQLELTDGPNGTCRISDREEEPHHDADAFVNGAMFQLRDILESSFNLRVVLKGDLIQDERGLGVDGNHLPPWLPNRPSGDGVEGGTFESWFTVEAREEGREHREGRENREDREHQEGREGRESGEHQEVKETRQPRTRRR